MAPPHRTSLKERGDVNDIKVKNREKFKLDKEKKRNEMHTQNRFSTLSPDEDLSDRESEIEFGETSVQTKLSKKEKPPPLCVTDNRFSILQLKQLFESQSSLLFKKTSIATKIFAANEIEFKKCSDLLLSKNIEYFTHEWNSAKLMKMVLYGLPKTDISVIKQELEIYKLSPVKIAEIQPKSADDNYRLFLVHFYKDSTSINQVKSVNCINNMIVRWKPFVPRKVNDKIIQCFSCLMFGHGGSNYHRIRHCMKCADTNHSSSECIALEENFKCQNCIMNNFIDINHMANHPECPSKQKFIDIRNNIKKSNQVRKITINQNHIDLTNVNQFPPLPINPTTSPSLIVNEPSTSAWNHSNIIHNNSNSTSDDLYSTEELLRIFMVITNDLKKCTTKQEQLTLLITHLLNNVK